MIVRTNLNVNETGCNGSQLWGCVILLSVWNKMENIRRMKVALPFQSSGADWVRWSVRRGWLHLRLVLGAGKLESHRVNITERWLLTLSDQSSPHLQRPAAQSLLLISKPLITLRSIFSTKVNGYVVVSSILPSPGSVSPTPEYYLSAFCKEKVGI